MSTNTKTSQEKERSKKNREVDLISEKEKIVSNMSERELLFIVLDRLDDCHSEMTDIKRKQDDTVKEMSKEVDHMKEEITNLKIEVIKIVNAKDILASMGSNVIKVGKVLIPILLAALGVSVAL